MILTTAKLVLMLKDESFVQRELGNERKEKIFSEAADLVAARNLLAPVWVARAMSLSVDFCESVRGYIGDD